MNLRLFLIVVSVTILTLSSCVSIPEPTGADDSLVGGFVTLEYPDGFYDLGPRTFTNNIALEILDETSGESHTVYSAPDGFFRFPVSGTSMMQLVSVSVETTIADITYTGGYRLNYPFSVQAGAVNYIGDFAVTFASPRTVEHQAHGSRRTVMYAYDQSARRSTDMARFLEVFREAFEESAWRDREVVSPPSR